MCLKKITSWVEDFFEGFTSVIVFSFLIIATLLFLLAANKGGWDTSSTSLFSYGGVFVTMAALAMAMNIEIRNKKKVS